MESAKYILGSIIFRTGTRITIAIFIFLILVFFITRNAIKVYSESETKLYRQESVFSSTANSTHYKKITKIEVNHKIIKPVFSMSYEVDKITPTPTPIYDPKDDEVWLKLATCESHQNWGIDTGNGYYGGLQFTMSAWASVGGSGKPSDASADEQIMRGKLLQQIRGWRAWGGCSKKLGLL